MTRTLSEKRKAAKKPWNFKEALKFVRELSPLLKEIGYDVTLLGSVLINGHSDHDLDIGLFPLNDTCCGSFNDIEKVLTDHGLELLWNDAEVTAFWRKQGSMDTKYVEVWSYQDHRVDVFYFN